MWSHDRAREELDEQLSAGDIDLDEFWDKLWELEEDWRTDVQLDRQESADDALYDELI